MEWKDYLLEFRAQDHTHFKSFYDLTNKQIYLTALAILKNSDEALDIVQDTYLNFLQNVNDIEAERFHNGYLIRIARNLSLNKYKQNKRQVISEEYIDNLSIEDNVFGDAKIKAILDLLEDELMREIIVYHVLLDYKFKDIAKIIAKPLGTTLWLYNKGIKLLKERVTL